MITKRIFLAGTLTLLIALGAIGQNNIDWSTPIPKDPKVIIGTLDNGMTYYIRQNNEPQERAEFYIVHNVGAVLEDDDQDGLAHVTEHMAFRSTKNFPNRGIVNFLENVGVRYGHNINAFTSQEVTAYNLSSVPTTRESVIDTVLLILHDWSSYISFNTDEIEVERGVIREEWRTRRTGQWRLMQAKMDYLFHGSKYAKRDIIGDFDIINNFERQTLINFYNDWYRPDLQAIIAVGDFDPELMEGKIRELFSGIPAREEAKPLPHFEIPNHDEPLVGIYTDPEATRTMVEVIYKHPRDIEEPRNLDFFRNQLKRSLFNQMLNSRFNEIVQQEDPPFVFGYSQYSRLVKTKSVYALIANAREGRSEQALRTVLSEGYRVQQHGFTPSELDRAKADLIRSYETAYRERDQIKNEEYVNQLMSHFTSNLPLPNVEFEYMFASQVVPSIALDEINSLSSEFITDKNQVIFISGPDSEAETIPSKEKVLQILQDVKTTELEPWEDDVSDDPLVPYTPEPGEVVKESHNQQLDATEWTLANGLKVILKPTDFKDDEIRLSAFSPGGSSLVDDELVPSAMLVSAIATMSGTGNFSRVELDRKLAGRVVSVSPYLSEFSEGFTGSCSPDDFETMLQLTYLYFTNPRFDQSAFNAYMSRLQAVLQNTATNPNAVFNDSVSFIMNSRHPRKRPVNVSLLEEVQFDAIESIFNNRIKDASDFTFILVGNFSPDSIKPIVETYLGSIPDKEREDIWKDNNIRFPAGENRNTFNFPMKDPKASCFIAYSADAEYSRMNRLMLSTINHILDLRYTEKIREEEGGTYGVAVRANIAQKPTENVTVSIYFDTDIDKANYLVGLVHVELKKLMEDGPSPEDLNKAKEHFIKNRQEQLRENRFWVSALQDYYQNDINLVEKFDELVRGITPEDIKKAANEFFGDANMLEVIMRGDQ